MTLTGSGVGGNVGGPMQPLPREVEATAWTMVNKAALGIMPDTLEVPFSQLGGNVWKYQSDANRPTLGTLANLRTDISDESKEDDSWKLIFDALTTSLHPQMKKRLQENMGKPFAARNQNYSILENLMTLTAKGMAWLENAEAPMEVDSPEWERTEQNQALPGHALRGVVSHSRALLTGTKAFLQYVGPNHPRHDELNQFTEQGEEIQKELNSLLESLQGGEIPDQKMLDGIAAKANALTTLYGQVFHGDDMQLLGPLFESMALIANALALTPTSPSLFFGLKLASMGLFSKESSLGLLGDKFEALLKAITNGTLSAMMNKVGIAKQLMLLMSLLGLTTGAMTLAGLIAEFGIGRYPQENEGDEREGHVFTFQMLLELLASSGMIAEAYKIAVEACGGLEKAQELISEAMELVSLLLMALTGTKGNPKSAGILLEGIKGHLGEKIDKLEKFVLKMIYNGVENPAQAKGLDIALKQAKIAVDEGNFEGLIEACGTALDLLHVSTEELQSEVQDIKEFSKLLNRSCVPEARGQTRMIRAG
jgi:hypothetical protein